MSPRETRPRRFRPARVRGLGLSLRIAGAFLTVMTLLLGVGGALLYRQATRALDEAVDSFGTTLARTLALQGERGWAATPGSYAELARRVRELRRTHPAWLQAEAGVVAAADLPPPGRERLRRERRQLGRAERALRALRRRRLLDLVSVAVGRRRYDAEVLDVLVYDRRGRLLAKARPERLRFTGRWRRPYLLHAPDGTIVETATEITEGMVLLGGRRVPARAYAHPLYGPAGPPAGRVEVLLSEARIAARKERLLTNALLLLVGMLAAGAAASYLLGRVLATPLLEVVGVVEAVARGDLSRKPVGHGRDEIGQLKHALGRMVEALREAERDQTTLAARERELALVAELRRTLLPQRTPRLAGFELEASYRPTRRTRGNYYDFLELRRGLGILVADCPATGPIAGLTLNLFRGLLHAEKEWLADPVELFARVNEHLSRDIQKGLYVTALLVVVEPGSPEVVLVNAGHLPLLKWEARSRKLKVALTEGIGLGLDPGPVFAGRLKATRLRLEKGDRLVLYTEGVHKVTAADGTVLGEEGFRRRVARFAPMHSAAFINLLERDLERFREGGPETDDYTIITLKAA